MQDAPSSSASKVSPVMMRHSHSHRATDDYDKIKQWIREQGTAVSQQCSAAFIIAHSLLEQYLCSTKSNNKFCDGWIDA